jgi:hypothetical protein
MSEALFYKRVVPLNDKTHAGLRVRGATSHAYAAAINSVPLLGSEFFECAQEYPIIFTRTAAGLAPIALLGLRESENLFVDAMGKWSARYIPAFVRRYPFVPGNGTGGEVLVCIDEASPCFDPMEGEALFVDGKPTAQLEHAMQFLNEFHQAALATEQFVQRLDQLGLLRQADSVAQLNDGSQFRLNGLHVVDETRLRALPSETIQELFASGALKMIYAHLLSLGNLAALVDRLSLRTTKVKESTKESTKAKPRRGPDIRH